MAGARSRKGRKRPKKSSLLLIGAIVLLSAGFLGLAFCLFSSKAKTPAKEVASGESPNRETKPPEADLTVPTERTQEGTKGATAVRPKVRGKLALVIDDAGYNSDSLDRFLSFPGPLAVSVLPELPHTREAVEKTRRAGKELLLHLPMEPEGKQNPGPMAILTSQKNEEIARILNLHLDALPGIRGVNNHMGSKATADERVMRVVLGELKKRSLFFLDSLTGAGSVGKKVAAELKLPYLERSVFLDNEKDKTEIQGALEKAKAVSEKRGYAVMIGHVWCSELADVLLERYPQILDEGYLFYPVSDLLSGGNADDDTRD